MGLAVGCDLRQMCGSLLGAGTQKTTSGPKLSRSERVGLSAKVKEWIQSLAPKLLVMEQTETLELSLRIHTLQHLDDYSSLLFMFV